MKRLTRSDLAGNNIFVFGSNTGGIHGKGAALDASRYFGAIWGQAEGAQGQSYAIPTKDSKLRALPTSVINIYVGRFLIWAKKHPHLIFVVTPIGCGLAGYTPRQIAPLFRKCLMTKNIVLPEEFKIVLDKN